MASKLVELEATVDENGVLHLEADIPTGYPKGKRRIFVRVEEENSKPRQPTPEEWVEIEKALEQFPEEKRESLRKAPNVVLLKHFGKLKEPKMDGVAWQREIRSEWDEREKRLAPYFEHLRDLGPCDEPITEEDLKRNADEVLARFPIETRKQLQESPGAFILSFHGIAKRKRDWVSESKSEPKKG